MDCFSSSLKMLKNLLKSLPVEKFYGIGKVTALKMHKLGIHNGADLKRWDLVSLVRNFGKAGVFFYDIVRGIDDRPVEPDPGEEISWN